MSGSIPHRQFCKISVLGGMVSWKILSVLKKNFEKALLKNLICSYGIYFSWKILCVLAEFWENSPGNFDMFWYILPLLGNLYVFFYHFWFPWKIWCVLLIKEICLSWKFEVFLLHLQASWKNLMCSRNPFTKAANEQYILNMCSHGVSLLVTLEVLYKKDFSYN